ncbi:MAG: hypothetical protein BWY63_02140 [Chloroflexi bacterium ADurb.Bin360]|nr:MAG: hypothetical protein BWY63_02140 [Chloroflexi bacterium ADurb.Bin360]
MILASPHTSPELVQLRQAKTLSAINQHDRGIGNINSDLYHRSRDENVQLTPHKARHHGILIIRFHTPVQQSKTQNGENFFLQALDLYNGSARLYFVRFLDQRIDDESLSSLRDLIADEPISRFTLSGGKHTSFDGLPSRWHFIQHRDIQVPPQCQFQRARDWRRRHHEQMRVVSFLPQGAALLDTETVLLVNNRESQIFEIHLLLNERMRSDN